MTNMLNEALTETKNRIRRNTEVFQIGAANSGNNCLAHKDLWRMKNVGQPCDGFGKIQPGLEISIDPGQTSAAKKYPRIAH